MKYQVIQNGDSRSFPNNDPFLASGTAGADVMIYLGDAAYQRDDTRAAILIELGTECLGDHTGEHAGEEGSNTLGFNRFRNGDDAPSNLIELVRQPASLPIAIEAARTVFEEAGFEVALCSDQAGRIIDRLVRPKYNYALKFLDEGLATAEDMDLTCRMGLGYADGPIERVERGGLAHHYDITQALFEVTGAPGYAPARRAAVAKRRAK